MGKQIVELEQLLMKEQATFGAAEASLTNSDFAEVLEPKLEINPSSTEMRYVGANSGQGASVMGPTEPSVSFQIPMRTAAIENATTGMGFLGKVLRGMGMKVTSSDTDADATNDRHIYTISDVITDWKDYTIWGHSGNRASSGALLRKISNVMFGGKISLNFSTSVAMLSVDGKGVWGGPATAATQASCSPSGVLVPALRGATFSLLGDTDYTPISLDIDFRQEPIVTLLPTATYGKGQTIIKRNGSPTFALKCYKDIPSVVDPELASSTPSTGTLICSWGTAPNKITITMTVQITSYPDAEENGISCWTLSGHNINSDIAIQLDCAVGS